MRQIDIINELNRMVIGYNITWDMIKYDADRAIMRINAHLGAEYPMMSEIMLSPQHRYTINYKNVDVPIFPERYILTVVIPFIATEVLARDEEFTTIYNKYAMDFENGLFDMFQNEFNKVPPVFRQDKDIGVFFSKDIKEYKKHEERDCKLPEFKFNVYYHLNTEGIHPTEQFTTDLNKYDYKSKITLKDTTLQSFIKDIYSYEFKGWMLNPDDTTYFKVGDELEITKDLHLYAKWDRVCILHICTASNPTYKDTTYDVGTLHIKSEYNNSVINLIIPNYVEGTLVKVIPDRFDYNTSLVSVTLPRTNLTIKTDAFTSTTLQSLILPSYDYLREYPKDVKLESECIVGTSITYLYIPYSVSTIAEDAIRGVAKIQCEIETNPSGWSTDADGTLTWTNCTNIDWGVANG